jgi:hypothetical protein
MSKNIQQLERERDDYIVQLANQHPDWGLRKIAAEVKKVYGKCSHEHVRFVLNNQGDNRN